MGFKLTQPTWDEAFPSYDASLAAAAAANVSVMALLNNESVPAPSQQRDWNVPPTGDGRNAYTQRFVDAARILMTRYGDQIKYWEIWNEPNTCTSSDYLSVCEGNPLGSGGSFIRADLYAKMLAEVWVQNQDLIRAKGLHLVAGGLYAHDVNGNVYVADDYMQEVYSNGVWSWIQAHYGRRYVWDKFGYHVYTALWGGPLPSWKYQAYMDGIASVRGRNGDGSPIWMTEFGWWTPQISEAQQAQNYDTALNVLQSRADVERTFNFRTSEWQGWGIFRGDWSAKPAVDVYRRHTAGCVPNSAP